MKAISFPCKVYKCPISRKVDLHVLTGVVLELFHTVDLEDMSNPAMSIYTWIANEGIGKFLIVFPYSFSV
jgi:hypothetical protein